MNKLITADCLEAMREMDANSVTAIVTDPPYALEFMGKGWDKVLPSPDIWAEALRVVKPGGMLLSFGGTRTFHRLTCAIEDAGWVIKDCIFWVYATGFPKSLNISKAIDKAAGAEREVVGNNPNHRPISGTDYDGIYAGGNTGGPNLTAPSTDEAKLWDGWGTALKPAWEPIIVAMKPLDGTYAANALKHGVAGINIDGCRVETRESLGGGAYAKEGKRLDLPGAVRTEKAAGMMAAGKTVSSEFVQPQGRWPANLIHDGSDEVLEQFPVTSGGSAARFFYCSKANKKDRGEGNVHPTVKPTALMQYLVRLVKMPKGTVILDPFMGSGSTGVACIREGVDFIGIDQDESYVEIARKRICKAVN